MFCCFPCLAEVYVSLVPYASIHVHQTVVISNGDQNTYLSVDIIPIVDLEDFVAIPLLISDLVLSKDPNRISVLLS